MYRLYKCAVIIAMAVAWAGLASLASAQSTTTLTPKVLCVSQTPHGYWATFRYLSTGLSGQGVFIPPPSLTPHPIPPPPVPKDYGENNLFVGDTSLDAPPGQRVRGQAWPFTFADKQVSGPSAFPNEFIKFAVWFPTGSSATWQLRLPDSQEKRIATATADSPKCPLYNEPWGDAGTPDWPIRFGYERIAPIWPGGCVNIHHYILRLPRSYRAGTKVTVVSKDSPTTATPPFLLTGHSDPNNIRKIIPWSLVRSNHTVRLGSTPCGKFTVRVRAKGHKDLHITRTRIPPPWSPYSN
jgi:hypothetical protein